MSEPKLDEEMKAEIRALSPAVRATLHEWFTGHPHYTDLIAFLDTLKEELN